VAPARILTVLGPGEALLGTWVAGLPTGRDRGAKYGGTLVLTTQRLIWEPLNLPAVLKRAPGMRGLEGLTRGMPLDQIVAVRADPDRRALLQIDGLEGSMRFLIAASRMSPIWSGKNQVARNGAADAIQAALSKRRA